MAGSEADFNAPGAVLEVLTAQLFRGARLPPRCRVSLYRVSLVASQRPVVADLQRREAVTSQQLYKRVCPAFGTEPRGVLGVLKAELLERGWTLPPLPREEGAH